MELFQTVRSKMLKAYGEAGQHFTAKTLPYHSTRQLQATISQVESATATAFALFAAGQELRFFTYGLGDRLTLGANQVPVTEADTNLAKGGSTNGASDFVIEGFGVHARGLRVQYDGTDGWGQNTPGGAALDANNGDVAIYDPAAIIMPPQAQSPFNLEDGLLQHLAPLMSISAEWDRKSVIRLGTLDLMPRAGGGSMLRANGLPTSENRFKVPEGLIWRRDGQPDSEFAFVVKLERSLVVPISLLTLPGGESVTAPEYIYLELVVRLFGLSVELPSQI